MKVKALTSFCGVVTMMMGEVGEISDLAIVKDLLNAGYIEEVKDKPRKKKGDNNVN